MSAVKIDSNEPYCNGKNRGHNLRSIQGVNFFCVEVILNRIKRTVSLAGGADTGGRWWDGMSAFFKGCASVMVCVNDQVLVLVQKKEKHVTQLHFKAGQGCGCDWKTKWTYATDMSCVCPTSFTLMLNFFLLMSIVTSSETGKSTETSSSVCNRAWRYLVLSPTAKIDLSSELYTEKTLNFEVDSLR